MKKLIFIFLLLTAPAFCGILWYKVGPTKITVDSEGVTYADFFIKGVMQQTPNEVNPYIRPAIGHYNLPLDQVFSGGVIDKEAIATVVYADPTVIPLIDLAHGIATPTVVVFTPTPSPTPFDNN